MNVICLEEDAFHKLIEEVVSRLSDRESHNGEPEWKWVAEEKAKELLQK